MDQPPATPDPAKAQTEPPVNGNIVKDQSPEVKTALSPTPTTPVQQAPPTVASPVTEPLKEDEKEKLAFEVRMLKREVELLQQGDKRVMQWVGICVGLLSTFTLAVGIGGAIKYQFDKEDAKERLDFAVERKHAITMNALTNVLGEASKQIKEDFKAEHNRSVGDLQSIANNLSNSITLATIDFKSRTVQTSNPPPASKPPEERSEVDEMIDSAVKQFNAGGYQKGMMFLEQAIETQLLLNPKDTRRIAKALLILRQSFEKCPDTYKEAMGTMMSKVFKDCVEKGSTSAQLWLYQTKFSWLSTNGVTAPKPGKPKT